MQIAYLETDIGRNEARTVDRETTSEFNLHRDEEIY